MEKAKGTRGQQVKRKGSGGSVVAPPEDSGAKTLTELGISKKQSSSWQQLADICEEDFEATLAGPDKPTTSGIIAQFQSKPVTPAERQKAIWLWGTLRDFEHEGLLSDDPAKLFEDMLPYEQDEALRLIPLITDWLERFESLA